MSRNQKPVLKCCKNCGYSYSTPIDNGFEHKCDIITSGEITSKEDCFNEGYKWFALHERFIYGTYEEQEKILLEQREKFLKREQEQRKEREHLRRILFEDHYLDEVVRLAEKAGYIKVVYDEGPDRCEQPELF